MYSSCNVSFAGINCVFLQNAFNRGGGNGGGNRGNFGNDFGGGGSGPGSGGDSVEVS